ncbi:MAG: hypothetical protein R6V58_12905 [Planctomycetota bacterium]
MMRIHHGLIDQLGRAFQYNDEVGRPSFEPLTFAERPPPFLLGVAALPVNPVKGLAPASFFLARALQFALASLPIGAFPAGAVLVGAIVLGSLLAVIIFSRPPFIACAPLCSFARLVAA